MRRRGDLLPLYRVDTSSLAISQVQLPSGYSVFGMAIAPSGNQAVIEGGVTSLTFYLFDTATAAHALRWSGKASFRERHRPNRTSGPCIRLDVLGESIYSKKNPTKTVKTRYRRRFEPADRYIVAALRADFWNNEERSIWNNRHMKL